MTENDSNFDDDGRYYTELAAAFVRGRIGGANDLSPEELIALGRDRGLRLHKFKRQAELPRVRKVLGVLQGLAPASLLDIGSGREHCISLCAAYNARVRIIYVETGAAALAERNRSRERGVPPEVINRLLARWEPPDLTEAHQVKGIIR